MGMKLKLQRAGECLRIWLMTMMIMMNGMTILWFLDMMFLWILPFDIFFYLISNKQINRYCFSCNSFVSLRDFIHYVSIIEINYLPQILNKYHFVKFPFKRYKIHNLSWDTKLNIYYFSLFYKELKHVISPTVLIPAFGHYLAKNEVCFRLRKQLMYYMCYVVCVRVYI